MAEATITDRVLDTLVSAGLLTAEQLTSLHEASSDGATIGGALLERGLVTAADLGTALEDEMGVPRVDLSSYAPDEDALAMVPAGLAKAKKVLPLFEIDGTLTVAVGDPMDVFELDGVAAQVGADLDPVLTDSTSLLGAIVQYYGEGAAEAPAAEAPPVKAPEAPAEVPAEEEVPRAPAEAPPPEEAAAPPAETIEQMAEAVAGEIKVDLDVLAVADATKVALLVTDILEDAVARGATGVHLLPYKEDFFLVYRIGGKLEKVASAPLSMQGALVDGFKSFGRISQVSSSAPAVGRVHTRLADKDLVLTVSVVPTISGQRLVASLTSGKAEPRSLDKLGMTEAEVRALNAMVERGRGILLVAAPVAEGRSSSYYALLAHAAASGKTAYSVERSIEYEIPAVAQVLVTPASPLEPAAYFAAGMRQDTDIVGCDGLENMQDVHLAIEAAGDGRLVICTTAGGDIASGVRRLLDMGAEPNSLAAALTLAVGQRLVRTNCPKCSQEKASPLAAKIPGGSKDIKNFVGAGCPNCMNTGFLGVTGVFEVLPFTEPVRAKIAASAGADEIAKVAAKAGMRPLSASGLALVESGRVSAEELNRVLRFA